MVAFNSEREEKYNNFTEGGFICDMQMWAHSFEVYARTLH